MSFQRSPLANAQPLIVHVSIMQGSSCKIHASSCTTEKAAVFRIVDHL
jgi:hypothetical protein